jgi:hypothetical protein
MRGTASGDTELGRKLPDRCASRGSTEHRGHTVHQTRKPAREVYRWMTVPCKSVVDRQAGCVVVHLPTFKPESLEFRSDNPDQGDAFPTHGQAFQLRVRQEPWLSH